jgi:prepilin-type N-terminal cleavage/methylation domain-containing protein
MIRRRGFTLLEILIASAISVGVLALATFFAIDITNFGLFLGNRLETERDLEQTLRIFISEVRSMGPSENGSYPIAQADTTGFTFFTDLDADTTFEQVRYFLNGTTLQKGVIEPAGTPAVYDPANEVVREVVPYVVPGSDILTYWGQGYIGEIASLSTPADVSLIRLVRMRATVDMDTKVPPGPSTQSIHVTIRNLRGEI